MCNQKQSIRKVFAQGLMARDIRKFVQECNMSRKSAEEKVPTSTQSEDIHCEWMSIGQKKKRTDWNEYIDLGEDQGNVELDENEEGKGEPRIVTELPKELCKKQRWNNYSSKGMVTGGEGGNRPYRPHISKKNNNNKQIKSSVEVVDDDEEIWPQMATSKWNESETVRIADEESGTLKKGAACSKWSTYLMLDETSQPESEKDSLEDVGCHDALDSILHDQRVEEDIHPDFL